MKRFLIQTFGCQMNAHDSRRIAEVLSADGYEATDSPELADLIVFNTCSVREKAEHKLVSALGRYRPLKERRKDVLVAVAGCMVQEHGAELLDRLDLADVLIGPDNIAELPELLRDARASSQRLSRIEFDLLAPSFLNATPERAAGREVCAYVTVMKGCDERCSFCIVPYTRGPERYRAEHEIVAEIAGLVQGGVREVTLLGQTVNSWSHDEGGHAPALPTGQSPLGPLPPRGSLRSLESSFPQLLRNIAERVPGLSRLRYTSPHPRHVTPALVRAHAELACLPAHVHLPAQSGSDRVLRRMIRRYTRADYVARAHALQAARSGLTISTDLIVGFPGETEEDFQETLSLCDEVPFVTAFAFKYSPRPHTPALKLGDDVPEEIKSERLDRLFERVDVHQQRHLASLVGSRARVLFEGRSKSDGKSDRAETLFTGRSDRHEIVHAAAAPGQDLTGLLLEVEIERANKRSLFGRLLEAPPALAARAASDPGRRLPVVSA